MSFAGEIWWWPYLFILIAGCLATNVWRYIGVYLGSSLNEDSEGFVLMRTIATAMIAAVVAKLVVFPVGALADTSLMLRLAAVIAGFLVFCRFGRSTIFAILTAQFVLVCGLYLGSY